VADQAGHALGLHALVSEHPAVAEALDGDARDHAGVVTASLGQPVDEDCRLRHGGVGAQVEQSSQCPGLH
jgi:hypothetical protein